MMVSSNRVPGQLLPVGAKWWGNAGRPLTSMQGLGQTLTSEQAAALILNEGTDVPSAQSSVVVREGSGFTRQSAAGAAVLGLLIRGSLGYVAGRAMAPSKSKKNTYGWWGVLAGGVFGVTGLAVQGAVALSKWDPK